MEKMSWIKCSDRQPDKHGVYLAVVHYNNCVFGLDQRTDNVQMLCFTPKREQAKTPDGYYMFGGDLSEPVWHDSYYNEEYGEDQYYDMTDRVTYWMPLPKLPDELDSL